MTHCICGASLPPHSGGGRQKHYCSDRCRQQAKRDRDTPKPPKRDDSSLLNTITTGDARELAKAIPDNSIDLIITDPPYLKDEYHLYEWLADEAGRVLKPGSFCFAYCGTFFLPEILARMSKHLDYFWTFVILHKGGFPTLWSKKIMAGYKPVVCFSKGNPHPSLFAVDTWGFGRGDKRFHKWGQAEVNSSYPISYYSQVGDLVWEPFTGGGTVPYVCKQLNRNFIAFELDPDTADIARKRLETVQPLLFAEEAVQAELEVSA